MSVDLNEIHHLAFEGGGGRGLVYLGAVETLEDLYFQKKFERPREAKDPVFPIIDIYKEVDKRPIKGISGTSAGAITAFMLSCGMTSQDIRNEIETTSKEEIGYTPLTYSKSEMEVNKFALFYEEYTEENFYKIRTSNGREKTHENMKVMREYVTNMTYDFFNSTEGNLVSQLASYSDDILLRRLFSGPPMKYFTFFTPEKVLGFDVENYAASRYYKSQADYFHSLLFCRGIFPGFAVREYFADLLVRFVPEVENQNQAKRLTFRDFFNRTGSNLVTVGTNLTKGNAEYFSVYHTPDFSVVDAVSISMNLPIAFRPFYIDRKVDRNRNKEYNSKYMNCFWGDGGMVNNYPINTFNSKTTMQLAYKHVVSSYPVASEMIADKESAKFYGGTLGFRLVDDSNNKSGDVVPMWKSLSDSIKFSLEDSDRKSRNFIELTAFIAKLGYNRGIDAVVRKYFYGEFAELNPGATAGILGGVFKTFMHPGGDGIVDTDEEKEFPIELDTTGLSVLDFSGPKKPGADGELDKVSKNKLFLIDDARNKTRCHVTI